MAKFKCPRCATIIEANDPTTLQCPNCGFPSSSVAPPLAPAATPMMSPPPAYSLPAAPGYSAPGQPYMGAPQQMSGMPPQKKASGQSIAALVLGICGFCTGWIPMVGPFVGVVSAILAVVFGIIGIRKANENPAMVGGKGLAIAGLVLGIVALAFVLLVLLLFAAFFEQIMEAAAEGA